MAEAQYRRVERNCSIADCGKPSLALGYCSTHYYRVKRHGTPDLQPFVPKVCAADGCDERATRKGLCGKHYERLRVTKSLADPVKRQRKRCTVCGMPAKGLGLCPSHLEKLKKYGDPLLTWRLANPKPPCRLCSGPVPSTYWSEDICSDRCVYRLRHGMPDSLDCAECGSKFRSMSGAVTCSQACAQARRKRTIASWIEQRKKDPTYLARRRMAQQRRRARIAKLEVENFSYDEIASRDHWKCGLCGEKVHPLLRYPSPMSGSIDHIVPIAKGGAHTRLNVQLSHLVCNMRKHDKVAGQLRLVG